MKRLKKIGLFLMLLVIGLVGGMGGSLKQAEEPESADD